MRRHPWRTLGVQVVAAAAVLGAIYLVGVVAPDAQPGILLVGAVAYLITIPLWYVDQRRLADRARTGATFSAEGGHDADRGRRT